MRLTRHRSLLAAAIVTAVAVTGALATALPAQAAVGCRVTYAVTSQWPGGFGANVTVNNLGDALTSWRLTWSTTTGPTARPTTATSDPPTR